MTSFQKITVEIPTEAAKELLAIAKRVGFADCESLLKNYVREVIIAARSDAAAEAAKIDVVAGASDLDALISERQKPAS